MVLNKSQSGHYPSMYVIHESDISCGSNQFWLMREIVRGWSVVRGMCLAALLIGNQVPWLPSSHCGVFASGIVRWTLMILDILSNVQ